MQMQQAELTSSKSHLAQELQTTQPNIANMNDKEKIAALSGRTNSKQNIPATKEFSQHSSQQTIPTQQIMGITKGTGHGKI